MTFSLPQFSLDLEKLSLDSHGPDPQAAHEALRAKFKSGEIGFYDWPNVVKATDLSDLQKTARELRESFQGALCIGIGGSHLGPECLLRALRPAGAADAFPIHWLTNVDSGAVREAVHFATQRKAATLVISKSGGTTETLSGFFHLSRHLDPDGFVMITDPEKGELRRLAKTHGWKAFPVPPNVGGRFSVLTAVGLLPALLGGIDVKKLLDGARAVRDALEKTPPAKNPAYALAQALRTWDDERHHKTQYLMPYASQLQLFGDWFVQLWGESLGKKRLKDGKSVGPTPVAALGTSDQHSLLQLFKEGPNDKIVGFMSVKPRKTSPVVGKPPFDVSPAFSFLYERTFDEITHQASLATEKSLNNSGVPTFRIELGDIDEATMGGLMFFFETACAFAGELYGVNAFDQPGVEESKKLLRESF